MGESLGAEGESRVAIGTPVEEEQAASAYGAPPPDRRLRAGQLRFFRTVAESVGVQGPTGGVVIGAAVLASISGGGTALVQVVAAVAMGFVAYAFVIFTRGFNSAGSVYGFTGAVAGGVFGFFSAWTLLLVYVDFAGGVYASTADEAQSAFAALGVHLPWQVLGVCAFALVTLFAYLDIRASSAIILALEGVSIVLVTVACVVVLARGGYHGHAFSAAPFRPDGASLAVLGLGVVYAFSLFSGFEAATTLGEESKAPSKVIPLAVASSLVVVALYEIGVAAVVTNAYPSVKALAAAPVPLVTVTDTYVAGWLGTLVAFGAVVSSFGAALACANGAARLLFALGRDGFGPASLRRTSVRTGAPVGALAWVAVVSLGAFAAFSWEHDAIRAVDIILTYGADLIIVAYILVVVAAIVYTIRSRMSPVKTIILLIGAGILGYVVKSTFLPFPAAPYNWVALVAGVSLVVGLVLPVASRRVREGVRSSPLLRLGTTRLLPGVAEGDGEARRTGAA